MHNALEQTTVSLSPFHGIFRGARHRGEDSFAARSNQGAPACITWLRCCSPVGCALTARGNGASLRHFWLRVTQPLRASPPHPCCACYAPTVRFTTMALPMDSLLSAVRTSLEGRGVLAKLRADLRLAVYTAIDEKERELGHHLGSRAQDLFRHDGDLRALAILIANFCDACGLTGTKSCLQAETGLVRDTLHALVTFLCVGAARGRCSHYCRLRCLHRFSPSSCRCQRIWQRRPSCHSCCSTVHRSRTLPSRSSPPPRCLWLCWRRHGRRRQPRGPLHPLLLRRRVRAAVPCRCRHTRCGRDSRQGSSTGARVPATAAQQRPARPFRRRPRLPPPPSLPTSPPLPPRTLLRRRTRGRWQPPRRPLRRKLRRPSFELLPAPTARRATQPLQLLLMPLPLQLLRLQLLLLQLHPTVRPVIPSPQATPSPLSTTAPLSGEALPQPATQGAGRGALLPRSMPFPRQRRGRGAQRGRPPVPASQPQPRVRRGALSGSPRAPQRPTRRRMPTQRIHSHPPPPLLPRRPLQLPGLWLAGLPSSRRRRSLSRALRAAHDRASLCLTPRLCPRLRAQRAMRTGGWRRAVQTGWLTPPASLVRTSG